MRSQGQIEMTVTGGRKVRITMWFWKVAEWRSARLRMNKLGLTFLGSKEGIVLMLKSIPPAGIERGA